MNSNNFHLQKASLFPETYASNIAISYYGFGDASSFASPPDTRSSLFYLQWKEHFDKIVLLLIRIFLS